MTFNQAPESNRSIYDSCDPKYLRDLREASGIDLVVLARTACLSVAQVRQLESDDNDGLFYSAAIKRQAYKRVLMILGAEPPTVHVPQALLDAAKVADAHASTLDQIVAMSEQPSMNRSTSDSLHAGWTKLKAQKHTWAALLLLVSAVTLFVLHGPMSLVDSGGEPTEALLKQPVAELQVSAPSTQTSEVVPTATSMAASSVAVIPQGAASVSMPTVSAAALAPAFNTTTKAEACSYSSESMPQLGPFVAQKEGRYVYLVSNANAEVCVVDGNKQATLLQLKAGENRSVYGPSPWQVSSTNLQKVQIFFQGGRVSVPDAAINRVSLVEVPIAR
jgi:hypothetical protein